MDDVEAGLRQILWKFVDREKVLAQTELYHELGIAGDDAVELLEDVHERFGTSFSDLEFDDYFPVVSEATGGRLSRLLGIRSNKRPLTFGHLVRVVERGRWFDPEDGYEDGAFRRWRFGGADWRAWALLLAWFAGSDVILELNLPSGLQFALIAAALVAWWLVTLTFRASRTSGWTKRLR